MDRTRFLSITLAGLLAAIALAGCTAISLPSPQTREITMTVEAMDWEVAPGVTTPVWAFCAEGDGVEPVAEGESCGVPGPTIHVTKGDRIVLTFRNTHSIPHTVHFHGWHPWETDMTGASWLSDSLVVAPGAEAVIEWTAEPAGTFIYHCHFDTPTHMDMGMYGAFIVDDPDEPDVDHDFVAVLDEWAIGDRGFDGAVPEYDHFTINGKGFPLTQAWLVDPGDEVRIHMVNAGYEFHAMHLHGYTPDSWEGVAGPEHAVPTDVREIAPGQSVVLDLDADREGVWLFHDHVVPSVTAGTTEDGFGAYPRGMLTVLVVGETYHEALADLLPGLLEALGIDVDGGDAHAHGDAATGPDDTAHEEEPRQDTAPDGPTVEVVMEDFAYQTETLEVAAGTTVTWANRDNVYHTVTFEDGSVDSGHIEGGDTWAYTFTEPGTYDYYCVPHAYQDGDGEWQGMVATVVVT